MAYTTRSTQVAGYVVTASDWNESVNNDLAGPGEAFTTDGDAWIATGANAGERVALLDGSNLVKRDRGGLEVALADPDADRILFWDDGAGVYAYLAVDSTLTISGTTLSITTPGVAQADQAALEAEANEDTYVAPDFVKFSPGVAKVHVNWEQTGAHSIPTRSYNMTSVTDGSAAGDTDHLWNVDFGENAGSAVGLVGGSSHRLAPNANVASTGMTTITLDTSDGGADSNDCMMAVFGDQA